MTLSYHRSKFELNIRKVVRVVAIFVFLISEGSGSHLELVWLQTLIEYKGRFKNNFLNVSSNLSSYQTNECTLYMQTRAKISTCLMINITALLPSAAAR